MQWDFYLTLRGRKLTQTQKVDLPSSPLRTVQKSPRGGGHTCHTSEELRELSIRVGASASESAV